MSYDSTTVTATGASATLSKNAQETVSTLAISGTYAGVTFTVEGTYDGTNWEQILVISNKTGAATTGGTSISPTDNDEVSWNVPNGINLVGVRLNVSAYTSGTVTVKLFSSQPVSPVPYVVVTQAAGTYTNLTASGTLAVTGAATLSSTLAVTGNVTVNTNKLTVTASSGNVSSAGSILSTSASGGVGYATGAGGAVTQITSRTTGVTVNTPTGAITLVSAAGSATAASFTVTNSSVAATDTVVASVKSGTDPRAVFVTAVGAGSFVITTYAISGTTTETPVINFAVIKGVAA